MLPGPIFDGVQFAPPKIAFAVLIAAFNENAAGFASGHCFQPGFERALLKLKVNCRPVSRMSNQRW